MLRVPPNVGRPTKTLSIRCEQRYGRGTTHHAYAGWPVESSHCVLVAEDEFLIGESIEAALEDSGFTVLRASTGAEAYAALHSVEQKFCALVTDIRLGSGPSGWNVARHAREISATMPIIYVSGDSAHEHPIHGVPHSVMIQKPFVATQIITAIANLLNDAPPELPLSDE